MKPDCRYNIVQTFRFNCGLRELTITGSAIVCQERETLNKLLKHRHVLSKPTYA